MDYSNFLMLREELSLLFVIIVLFIYDLFGSEKSKQYYSAFACILFAAHTAFNIIPMAGGYAFGEMYMNLPITSVVKSIMNFGTLIILMQSDKWINGKDTVINRGEFYMLMLFTLFGMYMMVSAGDFIMFYIGMETASLPMAALISFNKYKHESYEAGAKYIFTSVFSSAIMLYGISLIYGTAGTLYFADTTAHVTNLPLQILAFVLFFSGIGFKISLVPFHQWTPDVYQGAPTSVTAYLSVISKGAGVFALMTVLYKVFGNMIDVWQNILYGVIIATITIANLFAVRQQNIKRFLAYSSISQAGYIMLGVITGTASGMTSVVYYMMVYMFSNLAAFGVVSVIEYKTGKVNIKDYNGLYQTNPMLSLVMMLSMFSLAGIPPFAGFFSKFFIFIAAASQGYYILVLIALINTIISLYYYLLVVKAMFINKSDDTIGYFKSDNFNRMSLAICVAAIFLLGLISTFYEQINTFSYGI